MSRTLALLASLALAAPLLAGPPASPWTDFEIFDQRPLEVKMGLLGPNPNPDVLVMVLWNDGALNRINAVTIPPPYDGTGVSHVPIQSGATLFAMGDICTMGTTVNVPYINNFNIEVARRSGGSWSMSTIPGTTTNNYTTSDCGVTTQGLFISGQDFNDNEVEIFRSGNAGQSYTFYGRYSTGIAGPFSGAIRDQLVTDPDGTEAFAISQLANGPIQLTHFDTSVASPGSFHNQPVQSFPPVPGSFQVVRESAGRQLEGFFIFTYNADNMARTIRVPSGNPAGFVNDNYGAINNNGSQYPFQGGTVGQASPGGTDANVLWGDYFYIDQAGTSTTDPSYPVQGFGGPIDRCQSQFEPGDYTFYGRYVTTSPDGQGTSLYTRREPLPVIFDDGFESGDVSRWECASSP